MLTDLLRGAGRSLGVCTYRKKGKKMKVTMMLADHAQAVGNKLYICGGGWSITGPVPTPSAIALDIKVPWDELDREHQVRLDLLDSDGQPVLVPTPQGPQPIMMEGTFSIDDDVDATLKPGMPLDAAFAINLGPLMLAPGGRYVWQLTINGESHDDWRAAFSTRPALAEAA
jgi:hypothetical protein